MNLIEMCSWKLMIEKLGAAANMELHYPWIALCDLANWNNSNNKKSNKTNSKVIPLWTIILNFSFTMSSHQL